MKRVPMFLKKDFKRKISKMEKSMKTRFFKTVALLISVIFILSSLKFTALAKCEAPPLRGEKEAKSYILGYASEISKRRLAYSVTETQCLESFTELKRYVIYSLSPSGYAIYDEISGVVEEMMLDVDNPYKNAKGTNVGKSVNELYYGGPGNYIVKLDDRYLFIESGTELSKKSISDIITLEKYSATNRQKSTKGIPTTTDFCYMESTNYFTSMLGGDFGNNTSGTCTHVACTILLGYYNKFVDTRYVPEYYEINNGTNEEFHVYLQTFMGAEPSGLANAARGLNSYFSVISFSEPEVCYDIGNHEVVYMNVVNNVYLNRPTVIAMFESYNQNCEMNHSVVAYGYRVELLGPNVTSAAYFVHNGWHGNELGTYAWDWFADDLYINN